MDEPTTNEVGSGGGYHRMTQITAIQEADLFSEAKLEEALSETAETIQLLAIKNYTSNKDRQEAIQYSRMLALRVLQRSLNHLYKYEDNKKTSASSVSTSIKGIIDVIQYRAGTINSVMQLYDSARQVILKQLRSAGFGLRPKETVEWEQKFFREPANQTRPRNMGFPS